jgi:hypothetical protein
MATRGVCGALDGKYKKSVFVESDRIEIFSIARSVISDSTPTAAYHDVPDQGGLAPGTH